ncbi:hypothetical protein EVAR_57680_1 [Eumeta japonica]|uniref:Uncharacterized protein n=1 Tax=Eumeta variegata TaxID=151549 RepID=A0A4C1YQV1_EUMVA|nr:hypothetical protein EVAR_57680_1 [Eumeta japonica]
MVSLWRLTGISVGSGLWLLKHFTSRFHRSGTKPGTVSDRQTSSVSAVSHKRSSIGDASPRSKHARGMGCNELVNYPSAAPATKHSNAGRIVRGSRGTPKQTSALEYGRARPS